MSFLKKIKRIFIKNKQVDFYKKRGTKVEESISPSGNYKLEVYTYETRKGCWNVTQGIIRDSKGNLIAKVKRNYHRFWYFWIEHSNKKEYLLCGEDYQGQTIVDLQNKEVISHIPKEAEDGRGYCWAKVIRYNKENDQLEVDGCFWGDGYTRRTYDLTYPEELPYKLLQEKDTLECGHCGCEIILDSGEYEKFGCDECYDYFCEECLYDHESTCKENVDIEHRSLAYGFSLWVIKKLSSCVSDNEELKIKSQRYFLENRMWEEAEKILIDNPDSGRSAYERMGEYYDKTYTIKLDDKKLIVISTKGEGVNV